MPTYDYLCSTCGQRFEIFHKMNEQGPKIGPNCVRQNCRLEKQLAAPAAVVKAPNPLAGKTLGNRLEVSPNQQQGNAPEQPHICGSGCAFHKH